MTLEEIMLKNWNKIRERFFYPGLPMPVLVGSDQLKTAAIEMIEHHIGVSKDFVEEFHQKGLSYDTIFTALLSHELNHYLCCPFDLARGLMIDIYASKVDKDNGPAISGIYSDLVVNLDLIMRKGVNEVGELIKAHELNNPVTKVIRAYYQRASGYDMEFDAENELDDFLKEKVDQLMTIDFFDFEHESRNVRRFARIIKSILQKYNMKLPKPQTGSFGPKAYTKNEINKAMREVAKKVGKDDFDKIVEANELKELLGIKPGTEEGENEARDILYYQKIAENFPIGLKKRPVEKNGSMYPHSHKPFEIDDSPQDVDVFASLGKPFIPGLGKSWVKKEGEHYAEREEAPNVVIMKDISGSMQDCEPYAEAACVAAANAYLDNDAKAAVYLFDTKVDDAELAKGYQDDKQSVHSGLTMSNNGGTSIDDEMLGKLDEVLKASEKPADIVLVTDLEIGGREKLFEFLHNHQDRNRVTIIYTGKNGGIDGLQEKYADANFAIYHITSPEDIPKVVIGEVSKSIK